MKSVRIWSYSGPRFLAFGLNTERYSASLRMKSECGKMRTRITPNTDTFLRSAFFSISVPFLHQIVLSEQEILTNSSDHDFSKNSFLTIRRYEVFCKTNASVSPHQRQKNRTNLILILVILRTLLSLGQNF